MGVARKGTRRLAVEPRCAGPSHEMSEQLVLQSIKFVLMRGFAIPLDFALANKVWLSMRGNAAMLA